MALRTWLYNTIRAVSERFGYQEYEGPILESHRAVRGQVAARNW